MRKMKKGSISCKFDSHKWKESEDGMERICERCGISCADYSTRQRRQCWFRFLAFLRSKMKRLEELLTEPTEKYIERGRTDPFYQPTKWTIFGRPIWRILGVLILLITVYTILIKWLISLYTILIKWLISLYTILINLLS